MQLQVCSDSKSTRVAAAGNQTQNNTDAGDAIQLHTGLQTFRRLLRCPAVVLPLLAAYTRAYPGWVELSAIWDAQASRSSQDLHITVELLELLAQLLTLPQPPAPAAAQLASTWSSLQPALDDLAASILARRLKQLYFVLGSGGWLRGRKGGRPSAWVPMCCVPMVRSP